MELRYLVTDTRARVYLLWAILAPLGFVATHFYQQYMINVLWAVIAIVGLGFMGKVMPLRVGQMRKIFAAWLVPIFLGMCVSGLVFYVDATWAYQLMGHLGAFWLGMLALGYFLNGLVDSPSGWYWLAVALNAVASVACFTLAPFEQGQYLVAAIVSGWSMVNLWLFRSGSL